MKKETETLVAISLPRNHGILLKKLAGTKSPPCKKLSNNTEMLHDHSVHHQALYFQKLIVNSQIPQDTFNNIPLI